jgi:hypothetical protein
MAGISLKSLGLPGAGSLPSARMCSATDGSVRCAPMAMQASGSQGMDSNHRPYGKKPCALPLSYLGPWRGQQDLNLWPSARQADALTLSYVPKLERTERNRTHVLALDGRRSTIELRPHWRTPYWPSTRLASA